MAMDFDDIDLMLSGVDKLLNLAPFFKCPKCGLRHEDSPGEKGTTTNNTFFSMSVSTFVTVVPDDTRREFVVEMSTWFDNHQIDTFGQLSCGKCGHEFPVPKGWNVRLA